MIIALLRKKVVYDIHLFQSFFSILILMACMSALSQTEYICEKMPDGYMFGKQGLIIRTYGLLEELPQVERLTPHIRALSENLKTLGTMLAIVPIPNRGIVLNDLLDERWTPSFGQQRGKILECHEQGLGVNAVAGFQGFAGIKVFKVSLSIISMIFPRFSGDKVK